LIILCVFAVSLYLVPDRRGYGTHTQLGLPPCASKALLKISCPSCGMTTSFAWMSRGGVPQAFQANSFGPVLYSTVLAWWVLLVTFLIRGKRIKVNGLPKWSVLTMIFGYVGVYLATWLVRLWNQFG
jgi:hypothetical protein